MPTRRAAKTSQASCSTPDTVTATACARAVAMSVAPLERSKATIRHRLSRIGAAAATQKRPRLLRIPPNKEASAIRSEEHTSELQSRQYLVCRLLLEKKKQQLPSTI